MKTFNSKEKAVRRTLRFSTIIIAALMLTATAQAEVNWKSGGTPPISCEVTDINTQWLFGIGEWIKLNLIFHVTEDPAALVKYLCEAKTDQEGNYYHPREFRCSVLYSAPGHSYKPHGNTAEITLTPGVTKQDACQRVFSTGDVSATAIKK